MLKKFKPASLLPLGFAAAAAVAIIIACGNGEIITLDADKINNSRDNLGNLIDNMDGGSSGSGGEPGPSDGSSSSIGSSSSGGGSSSSGGSDGESSNSGGDYSSSGGNSSSSSSSEVQPPLPSDLTCPPGSTPVTGAACTWTPSTVISGDPARVSTSPATDGCVSVVFAQIQGSLGRKGIIKFKEGEDYVTADSLDTDNSNVKFGWAASGTENRIKSKIACGNNTCSEDVPCTLTITGAPAPIVTGDLACPAWDLTGNPGKLAIGTNISAGCNKGDIAISNNGQAQCGEITIEKDNGNTTVAGTVTFKAVATCRGTKHTLKTKAYEVVPNPTLTGTCAWNKNIAALDDDVRPSGITIKDDYGRCTSGGGVKYSGGNVVAADWPSNNAGNWPLKITTAIRTKYSGGITGVKPSAKCGTLDLTTDDCPKLPFSLTDVGEGENTGNCAYKWDWCNGWPMEIIKKNFTKSGTMRNACAYVKDISKLATGNYQINGTAFNQSSEGNVSGLPAKKDGGYYIWVPDIAVDGGASGNKWTVTYGDWRDNPTPPNGCQEGTPTNAVAICKSHCITTDAAVESGNLSLSTSDVTGNPDHRPYVLMVYGNSNCSNLRWIPASGSSSASCTFKLTSGNSAAATKVATTNQDIGSVNVSKWGAKVETLIEYKGGSGCPNEIKLKCN